MNSTTERDPSTKMQNIVASPRARGLSPKRLLPVAVATFLLVAGSLLLVRHLSAQSDSETEVILQEPVAISDTNDTPPEQSPPPVVGLLTTVAYGEAGVINCQISDGASPLMTINPGQAVGIQIQFAPELAGMAIAAEGLDGGTASVESPDGIVGPDGVALLGFIAATQPGLYRVSAKVGEDVATLQFWVTDPENPAGDPPLLLPVPPTDQ